MSYRRIVANTEPWTLVGAVFASGTWRDGSVLVRIFETEDAAKEYVREFEELFPDLAGQIYVQVRPLWQTYDSGLLGDMADLVRLFKKMEDRK